MNTKRGALHIGPLSPDGVGSHFNPGRITFTTPDRITNAGSKEPLSLSALWSGAALRPGCMDAYSKASKGLGC